jgi:hypothetical protein
LKKKKLIFSLETQNSNLLASELKENTVEGSHVIAAPQQACGVGEIVSMAGFFSSMSFVFVAAVIVLVIFVLLRVAVVARPALTATL